MLPTRRTVALAVVLGGAVAVPPLATVAAADPCPVTEMAFNSEPPFTSALAAFDTTASPTKELAYDVPAATLSLRADGKFWSFVRVHDTFTATGLAPGAQLFAILQLDVAGTIGTTGCGGANCWGYFGANLTTVQGTAQELVQENMFSGPPRPRTIALALPIVFTSGESIDAAIELYAYGSVDHQETATGTWSFPDLPSGVGIVSCRGFVQAPVPVAAATWGRVKAAYR